MNTSGDVDISPPDVVGGVGHSVPPEAPTSPPYVQVINQFDFFSLFLLKKNTRGKPPSLTFILRRNLRKYT